MGQALFPCSSFLSCPAGMGRTLPLLAFTRWAVSICFQLISPGMTGARPASCPKLSSQLGLCSPFPSTCPAQHFPPGLERLACSLLPSPAPPLWVPPLNLPLSTSLAVPSLALSLWGLEVGWFSVWILLRQHGARVKVHRRVLWVSCRGHESLGLMEAICPSQLLGKQQNHLTLMRISPFLTLTAFPLLLTRTNVT